MTFHEYHWVKTELSTVGQSRHRRAVSDEAKQNSFTTEIGINRTEKKIVFYAILNTFSYGYTITLPVTVSVCCCNVQVFIFVFTPKVRTLTEIIAKCYLVLFYT